MGRFMYFGYASNLTDYKVGMRCRSVRYEGNGRLDGFTVEFRGHSEDWLGGSATLAAKEDSVVWGAIWSIEESEKPILDEQEGVMTGMYKASTVEVVNSSGQWISCRIYEQVEQKDCLNLPSPQYLAVIVEGAEMRQLPSEYIMKLKDTKANQNTVITNMMNEVQNRRKDLSLAGKIF